MDFGIGKTMETSTYSGSGYTDSHRCKGGLSKLKTRTRAAAAGTEMEVFHLGHEMTAIDSRVCEM